MMTLGQAELQPYLDEHDTPRVSIHCRDAHFVRDSTTLEESDYIAAFMSC